MTSMNVRFVITGACFPSYSGRQIHLEIPLTQPSGARTSVADVEAQVRRDWPKDLSEMAETIQTIEVKILKTGRVLKDADVFEEQLTKTEQQECEVNADATLTPEELDKSSVLMHLFFKREQPPLEKSSASGNKRENTSQPEASPTTGAGGSGNAGNTSGGGREVKDDRCCSIM